MLYEHMSAMNAVVPARAQPMTRLIREEPKAVRAAEEQIAQFSHVGPHSGPGSGSGVISYISRLKTRFEQLDTWRDVDTDDSGDEEVRPVRMQRPPNRLMSYS